MSTHSKVITRTDTHTHRQTDTHTQTDTQTRRKHYLSSTAYAGGNNFRLTHFNHRQTDTQTHTQTRWKHYLLPHTWEVIMPLVQRLTSHLLQKVKHVQFESGMTLTLRWLLPTLWPLPTLTLTQPNDLDTWTWPRYGQEHKNTTIIKMKFLCQLLQAGRDRKTDTQTHRHYENITSTAYTKGKNP